MHSTIDMCANGAEVASLLDAMAKDLGRKVRVYVIGHKERSKEETMRLISSSDICVKRGLLDDPSRYEWVNK